MKYGIEITYANGKKDWCVSERERMEFEDQAAANVELRKWKKCWTPRFIRYAVKELP